VYSENSNVSLGFGLISNADFENSGILGISRVRCFFETLRLSFGLGGISSSDFEARCFLRTDGFPLASVGFQIWILRILGFLESQGFDVF